MRVAFILVLAAACGGSPAPAVARPTEAPATPAASVSAAPAAAAPAASTPAAPAPAVPAPAVPPPAVPPPTGGAVLVGDIPGTKKFDPKRAIVDSQPELLACYNKARAGQPDLSGKLKLRIIVNQAGSAVSVEAEPGGGANTLPLVECIREALKTVTFPKPSGMATVIAPLVFRAD